MQRSRLALGSVVGVLTAVALSDVAAAADRFDRHRDDRDWLGLLWFLLIAGLLAAAVVLAVVLARRPNGPATTAPGAPLPPTGSPVGGPTAAAEAILAERLARSEISTDEYRATLAALRGLDAPASSAPTIAMGVPPDGGPEPDAS